MYARTSADANKWSISTQATQACETPHILNQFDAIAARAHCAATRTLRAYANVQCATSQPYVSNAERVRDKTSFT